MIRNKKLAVWGSTLLTISIIFGAMGAHAMRNILDDNQLRGYLTATEYLTIHGLAFLILAILRSEISNATRLMRYGVLIFSGSIYLLTLLSAAKIEFPSVIGLITPFGGLLMIAGWIWATLAIAQAKEHKSSGK